MAYQEKYGGYGTNDDECGFDYFVDVSQMELGEHSILVQLLDEKDKVISEKDLKINIIQEKKKMKLFKNLYDYRELLKTNVKKRYQR